MNNNQIKRIVLFGTYRRNYARNQMLVESLRLVGYEVIECHVPLWKGFDDRVQIAISGWKTPSFWLRLIKAYISLIRKFIKIKDVDLIIVGYPGYVDIYLARILAWIFRKPLIWDVFNSLHLMMQERGIAKLSPLSARIVYIFEKISFLLPDRLILDNWVFVDWFKKHYKINTDKFRVVPIGADDRYFYPVKREPADDLFKVVYYGTYLPNHGIEYIVDSARILKENRDIVFEFIGEGPTKAYVIELIKKFNLDNISFVDWIDNNLLSNYLADAEVILGAFGTSIQLQLTNNNKVCEGMSMAKPVITGKSLALPVIFRHKENLLLCDCGSGAALAEAILMLHDDEALRESIAINGHKMFTGEFSNASIAKVWNGIIREI